MRLAPLAAAVGLLATALTAAPATSASAACPEVGQVSYRISNIDRTRMMTNLRSDYIKGPATIHYTTSKTSTVTASGTVTVGAEAGVIFAKASASASVTVGGSWSHSGGWSYDKPVPKGKTARLVQYHESRTFTVRKYRIEGPCTVKLVWTKRVKAPRKANINVWDLQYK